MIETLKKYVWRPIVNSARPDFCEHILDRALLEKWPVKRTHDAFILNLPVPAGSEVDPAASAVFATHRQTAFQGQNLICIPNGIAAGCGFVRLPTGEFLTESTWRMDYLLRSFGAGIYGARYRRHKLHLGGDCYYLDMLFSTSYAHWFLDEFPRLISCLPHLPPKTRFIVSDPIQQFKLQSLAAFGITEDRLVPVKGYIETHCERLWFATPLGSCEWASTSPAMFRRAGETLLKTYGGGSDPAPEKIFISRSVANYKRLINEEQLLPIIESFGFSVLRTEQLSFPQQIRAFSKAKVVLGAHGAGMTNLMFSPAPALLLELQDAKFAPRRWYWKVPTILGHHYSTMIGPVTGSRYEGDTDFTIHPDSLKKFLESSLSSNGLSSKQWWVSQ